jgi:hypothetical protein
MIAVAAGNGPMWWIIRAVVATILVAVCAAHSVAESSPARVVYVDRPAEAATFAGADAQGNLKFQVGGKVNVVRAGDVVYFGRYRDVETGPQIVLRDGSVIRADLLELADKTFTLGDAVGLGRGLWDESTLPRSALHGLLLQPPADRLQRDKLLKRIGSYSAAEDLLLLTSGESISGRLVEAPRSGRFQPADVPPAEVFTLSRPGLTEPLTVPGAKVVALMLGGRAVAAPARDYLQFGFRDGSLLAVSQAQTDGDTVNFTLAGGGIVAAPLDQPDAEAPTIWQQVNWLLPKSDRVTYLSDIKTIGYKHIPLLTLEWPYGVDENVLGGRLRSGGGVYPKGIGMHPISRLAYTLNGKYRRFEAELALDDAALDGASGPQGSVVFKVLVEREPNQWETEYESEIVRGGDASLPVSVDVQGARRIAMIVDYADHADEHDHANWLMARLIE